MKYKGRVEVVIALPVLCRLPVPTLTIPFLKGEEIYRTDNWRFGYPFTLVH